MKKDVIKIIPKLFSVNYQTFIDNRIFDKMPEENIKKLKYRTIIKKKD